MHMFESNIYKNTMQALKRSFFIYILLSKLIGLHNDYSIVQVAMIIYDRYKDCIGKHM